MNTDIVSPKTVPPKNGVAGYFVSMAIAIILLYAVNNISTNQIQPIDPSVTSYYSGWIVNIADNLANMHVPYLTRYFISCLWAINLFLGFTIMGNFTLLLYRPRWFHHLIMLVICALAILAVFVFYRVFPLDIHSESMQTLARIIQWVIMAAIGVALVLRLVQLLKALKDREPPQPPPDLPVTVLSPDLPVDAAQMPQPEASQLSPDAPTTSTSLELTANTALTVQPEPPQPPETPASPP
jgi:hypothetical protein